jgi:hypothetical protein
MDEDSGGLDELSLDEAFKLASLACWPITKWLSAALKRSLLDLYRSIFKKFQSEYFTSSNTIFDIQLQGEPTQGTLKISF